VTALLLLAAALGLSNLAASVGIGAAGVDWATRVRIAVVFGLFEAGMPVLGLVLGHGLADTIGHAARWLGGGVLVAFGMVGLVQAWRQARAGTGAGWPASGAAAGAGAWWPGGGTGWRMLVGGLVLSADNLAAGFALGAFHTSLLVAALVFGGVSVVMSLAGLELGAKIGSAAGDRSELVASGLLIAVGAAIAAGAL